MIKLVALLSLILLFPNGYIHSVTPDKPEITNIYHMPIYPVVNETITIYSTVFDPDGISQVELFYCVGDLCVPPIEMEHVENNTYATNITIGKPSIVYYHIVAKDKLENENSSTNYTFRVYPVPHKLIVDVKLSRSVCLPGESISIYGSTKFDNGAPAISAITLKISNQIWSSKTNITGNYRIEIIAPTTPSDYEVEITFRAKNFIIIEKRKLVVTKLQIPDLILEELSLPESIEENTEIYIQCTVRNIGTLNVTVNVSFFVDYKKIHTVRITLNVSQSKILFTTWIATRGKHTIMVYVDPDNVIKESIEDNNNKTSTIYVIEQKQKKERILGSIVSIGFVIFILCVILFIPVIKKLKKYRAISQTVFFILTVGGLFGVAMTSLIYPYFFCYACPVATASCPIGILQNAFVKIRLNLNVGYLLSAYLVGFLSLLGIIFGRAFCGWACPVGTFQELVGKIGKIKRKRELSHKFRYAKYVILVLIPITSYVFVDLVYTKLCPIGGLTATLPVFIFYSDLWKPSPPFFQIKVIGVALFIIVSILFGRFWCRYLCPVGAFLAPFNRVSLLNLKLNNKKCNKCGRCYEVCPMHIKIYRKHRDLECIQCGICVGECSRKAIRWRVR